MSESARCTDSLGNTPAPSLTDSAAGPVVLATTGLRRPPSRPLTACRPQRLHATSGKQPLASGELRLRTCLRLASFTYNIGACARSPGATDPEDAMRKSLYSDSELDRVHNQLANRNAHDDAGLPNRLLTAVEVAEFVGCHEETVRRAYLRGLLVSQRFGVRSRRFHPRDVLNFHPTPQACAVGTPGIRRGAPTRVS